MTKLRTIHELEKKTSCELRALKETYMRLLIASETWSYECAQILATLENLENVLAARRRVTPLSPG